jgi:carbon-monoxide dehydrogenase small subunit
MSEPSNKHDIELTINGRRHVSQVEARMSLSDMLRNDAGYTGVHLGCEHGVCGACTVIVDGKAVRSCLMLAVQADGAEVTTVEGLADADGKLHPVQQALREEHALQCGFCTPGVVMTLAALTANDASPSEDDLLGAMSGHICRCTGYQGIKRAARKLAARNTGESA